MSAAIPIELKVLLALTGLVLLWSGIGPFDRLTWLLEVAPVLIGPAILLPTYGKHAISSLM